MTTTDIKQTPLKALSIFSIEDSYDSPAFDHLLRDLKLLFSNAPDESLLAYYDTRQMVFEWLAKQGDEKRYGGRPTKKGNAFYYYKQAMKYGDLDAAQRYLKKYYELGGSPKSKLQSIKFEEIINKNSLPYIFTGNGAFILDRCNPDFINTNGEKVAIEVYARFYKEKDGRNIKEWKAKRSKRFAKYGWKIIYFDETQVNQDYVLSILGGG